MRTLVVGGGKVGSYLARKLAGDGHVVSVIEMDHDLAMRVVGETGVIVFQGDGTDVDLLKRADVHRSDWVFAVLERTMSTLLLPSWHQRSAPRTCLPD